MNNDRVRGVLIGLSAGDKNGGPVRMALRLAQSLAENGAFAPGDVLQRYLAWWNAGAFDTGPVTASVLSRIAAGMAASEAVEVTDAELDGMTAGCNTAHRVAPLAMASFLPDAELNRAALTESGLTHHSPIAGDTAVAVVLLCRALIRGEQWTSALALAADGRGPEVRWALDPSGPPEPGGFAPVALQAAIHFVGGAESFADALRDSIRFAGAANYCPVIVGSIGGARWGASAVPAEELRHCGVVDEVERAAATLAATWALGEDDREP